MADFVSTFKQDDTFESEDQKIEKINIDKISPDTQQVRQHFDEEKLSELADSIREHGIQNPIHVIKKDGGYTILTGERRYRAAKIATISMIPCIVHQEDISESKKKALQLIENLQRQDLSAIETAKGFDSLYNSGMGQREIARHLGISEGTVSMGMNILKKLPESWIKEIDTHYPKVSIKELYVIAKEKNTNKRAALYQKLMEQIGQKVEIEAEEPKKRQNKIKSEFTSEQFDQIWENLKTVVRRDKGKLALYVTPAKLQSLLEHTEEEKTEE